MKKLRVALLASALMITTTGCSLEKLGVRSIGEEKHEAVEEASEQEVESEPEAVVESTAEVTVEDNLEELEKDTKREKLLAKYNNNPLDLTPSELFELFCMGEIKAETVSDEDGHTYTIDANDFEFGEFADATSAVTIENTVDVDNDGELEFVLNNMVYGDMYFDCKDGKVVCLARGEGTAIMCTSQYYDGAYWVVHYGSVSSGTSYVLDKFNGNLEITESFRMDEINEADGSKSYYRDEEKLSGEEYNALYTSIFGYDSRYMMEGEELTESELLEYEAFLEKSDTNGFTQSSYRTPEDISWGLVFYNGAGIPDCEYPKEALDAYLKAVNQDSVMLDLVALSGADVRAFVEAKTGITDFDVTTVGGTYIPEYDMLFWEVGDSNFTDISVVKGVRNGNLVQVEVNLGDYWGARRRITLEGTGNPENPFRFCSNRELWEETSSQVIRGKNYLTGGVSTFTVTGVTNGKRIGIIEDNATVTRAYARIHDFDMNGMDDVKEIVFCDADCDGNRDIIVIVSDGVMTVPVVCLGYEDRWEDYNYSECKYEVAEWLFVHIEDMTADNVLEYIAANQKEFNSLLE